MSSRESNAPARRAFVMAMPAAAALAAAGCGGLGANTPPVAWYVLGDDGDAGAAQARVDKVLLVGPVDVPSFQASSMLVYGRTPGSRSHYQFAGWTESPGRRVGVLVERRLAARAGFAAVAQSTSGVRGDFLLNLSLESLYHDVSSAPGRARIALAAELVSWTSRTLVARGTFARDAAVDADTAEAAAAAMGRALAAVLDELCPWVERSARGAAR